MRILITNDDGIASPALAKLAAWARQFGEVTVVAPRVEQSGKSQAIDFCNAFEIKRVELPDLGGVEAYSVDSTPADCVRFAFTGLHRKYDIVFSGINRGYNLGDDIAYSGTIGAIFEAARLGTKAIAFSSEPCSFENAVSELDTAYSYIIENKLLDHAELLNVNFPKDKSKGICITRQGEMYYSDEFVNCGNDMYKQVGDPVEHDSSDLSFDINAVRNVYISVTPLTAIKTDLTAYEKIRTLQM